MKNLLTIFTSPGETFERIRDSKTAWILPTIAALILSVVSIVLQMPLIIEETKKSLLKQGVVDQATIDSILAFTPTTSYATVVVMSIIMLFIIALLLMLLNLIVRGEGKYMQLVNVVAYANLPTAVGTLLTTVLLLLMNAQSITDVTLSLGALVADKTGMMYRVLSLINPFTIWGLFLYVVGAAIMMKRPRKAIAIWIIVVWIVFSIISLLAVPTV